MVFIIANCGCPSSSLTLVIWHVWRSPLSALAVAIVSAGNRHRQRWQSPLSSLADVIGDCHCYRYLHKCLVRNRDGNLSSVFVGNRIQASLTAAVVIAGHCHRHRWHSSSSYLAPAVEDRARRRQNISFAIANTLAIAITVAIARSPSHHSCHHHRVRPCLLLRILPSASPPSS